jgi:hypothetical protein
MIQRGTHTLSSALPAGNLCIVNPASDYTRARRWSTFGKAMLIFLDSTRTLTQLCAGLKCVQERWAFI